VIPATFIALNSYMKHQAELDTDLQLEKLVGEIHSAYRGGNNTTRVVELSFPEPFLGGIEYIKIGDNILPLDSEKKADHYASWIRYKMKGNAQELIEVRNFVTNKEMNGPLVLSGGDYRLRLVHWTMKDTESFVTVEVI